MPSMEVTLPGNPTDYLPKSSPSQSTNYFSNHRISDSMSSVTSSTFLQRLKYFEQKTIETQEERRKSQSRILENGTNTSNAEKLETRKHSIKTTINNARREFPNETELHLKKAISNTSSNNSKEATPNSSRRSSATSNSRKESLKPSSKKEYILPVKCNHLSANDDVVPFENNNNSRSSKPVVRELSIRSTINQARESFSRINDFPELHKEKDNPVDVLNQASTYNSKELKAVPVEDTVTNVWHLENQNSSCDQFFSTGSSTVLVNEAFSKQFKVLLRGYLYQNVLISLQHFGDETFYELEDYFDLGLSVSELFKVYNASN